MRKGIGDGESARAVRTHSFRRAEKRTMPRRSSIVTVATVLALGVGAAGVSLALLGKTGWLGGGLSTAETWLRIRSRTVTGEEDRAAYEAFRKTQFELLESPVVLNAALRRPGIAELETIREQEDPVEWLAGALEIVVNDQSEVFKVRLRGKRGDELRRILEAVTGVYLEDIVNKDRADRLARRESLAAKHRELATEIASRKEAYSALGERSGSADDIRRSPRDARALEDVAQLRSDQAAVRSDIRSLEVDIAVAEEVGDPPDPRRAARLRILERQAESLAAEIEAATAAPAPTPAEVADLEVRLEEIERLENIHDQIGKQLESSAIELAAPPRVTLIEEVTVRKVE